MANLSLIGATKYRFGINEPGTTLLCSAEPTATVRPSALTVTGPLM